MAFFLGKDVSVKVATEIATYGVEANLETGGLDTVETPFTGTGATAYCIASDLDGGGVEQDAVTSVDLSIGAMDEDISYFGIRSQTKAEIKKETTLTITRKKRDGAWDILFNDGRWGVSGSSAFWDGLEMPTTTHGYRLFLEMTGSNSTTEVVTVLGACIQSHSVTMNTDGTQDETIEFMSYITPVFDDTQYTTPITSGTTGNL